MQRQPRVLGCVVAMAAGLALHGRADAGEIRGRILAGDRGASGVTLSAIPYEEPEAEARRLARKGEAPRPLALTTTRADGTFALAVPATSTGTYRVLAQGGGVVPSWVGGTYDAAETDDLGEHALARAETVAGRVVSATGAPIAGASVSVRPRTGGLGGDPEVTPAGSTVTTGPDGVFRSADASAEGNRLLVVAKSYGAATMVNVRAGAMPRPIALGLGSLVSGAVLKSDRKTPAAGALVRFEAEGLETPWVEAGADGRFQMSDLPARAGTIVAEGGADGLGESSTGALPLPPGHAITVVLAPPTTLEGLVLDRRTRTPVPRTRITVEDGARLRTARAGPDGRYQIRGLLPQRAYRLRADEPRYTPYLRDRVLLNTAERLRLDVPLTLAATLTGRVTDEAGKPVAGALGRIVPAGTGSPFGRLRDLRTADRLVFRTAADGTFKAARLAAGENERLTFAHPDFEPRTTGGLSLPPGSTKTVNVILKRGLVLTGRVRDDAGRPVAGAEVEVGVGSGFAARAARALGVTAMASARPKASTGGDGKFEVKGLSEGTYALTVTKDGYADHHLDRVPVEADRKDVLEITLASGAAISGTVSRRDGSGAAGYFVRAVPPEASGPGFGPFGLLGPVGERRPTGTDGTFSIPGLRAGDTYDLVVLGPDGIGARREGVSAPAEDVDIVVPGPGRITGRVIDAQTSTPLADFQVDFGPDRSSGRGGFGPGGAGGARTVARALRAATGEGGAGAEPVHSEDGTFVLQDVPPGTWEVVAQAKGYQSARVGGVTVDEGGTREGVEVRLTPGNAIRGRVLDGSTGTPVLDASVTLQRAGAGGRALGLLLGDSDARTDAEGQFSVEGVAAGSYSVVAQHPDYAQATTVVEVKEGPASADLRMMPGGNLGGTVLSETSTPLAGASVSLFTGGGGGGFRGGFGGFGGPGGPGGGQQTITDDGGHFRFQHVTAGRYSVGASLRGHQTAPVDVVLQMGESRDNLLLSLASGARIRGVVSGLPAALKGNVRVSASGADGWSSTTTAGADGTFELTGAPAGPVNLRATAGDFGSTMRSASAQIEVGDEQDDAQAQIVFESGFTLTGTVTRGGQPMADAMVTAGLGGGGPATSARTSSTGGYRLEGLSEGTYNVTAMPGPSSEGGPKSQQITISGDATLDIVIPAARVGGTVVDSGTRQPLADATVQAAGGQGGRGPRGATTDSNGHFSLEDLEPSAYALTVRKMGYQLATRDVTAAEGAGDDLVIELLRAAGIGIEARDASFGVPLHAVQVRATDGSGATAFAGGVILDTDGRGEIPSLPPGAYSLAVYASGYAPALLAVTAPAPSVMVALTVGGAIEIHAGPATLAHGNVRVQILTPGGAPYPFAFFSPAGQTTLSAPIRRLENLGPGSYVLQVENGPSRPFDVQVGVVTPVVLP